VWGPVAPVWKGEERFSSNLGMAKLGGHSLERGKTATALDKIQHEGVDEWRVGRVFGASSVGGVAEREKGEERGFRPWGATWHGGGHGAWPRPAGGALTMSRPVMTRTRRARAARRCSDRGTPSADGWAAVAVRAGRERRGTRARVGQPEKKTGWPSPDEQYGFGFI
jgi:hypothetical protein